MVRFIILSKAKLLEIVKKFTFHYGQIYYEVNESEKDLNNSNLHSTMVRFIMIAEV